PTGELAPSAAQVGQAERFPPRQGRHSLRRAGGGDRAEGVLVVYRLVLDLGLSSRVWRFPVADNSSGNRTKRARPAGHEKPRTETHRAGCAFVHRPSKPFALPRRARPRAHWDDFNLLASRTRCIAHATG